MSLTDRTALLAARVLAGGDAGSSGWDAIESGAIVVEQGRIVAVGRRADLEPMLREANTVVDLGSATLMPGLIDCHVHLSVLFPWERGDHLTESGLALSTAYGVENGRQAIACGVTTVRDLGCEHRGIFGLRRAIESGAVIGPRIVAAGQGIAMTGGHGVGSISVEADGPDAMRAAARAQLKVGADCIKLMATGGCNTPGEALTSAQLTETELAAAIDVARQAGKPSAAHATSPIGIQRAVRAGITSIEHGVIVDDFTADLMAVSGIYYVPTMAVYHVIAEKGGELGLPHYWYAKGSEALVHHASSVRKAIRAGVKIAVGTDGGYRGNPVGPGFVDELCYLVEAGLPPRQALADATSAGAELLGLGDRTGTLAVGLAADLIAVDGNPLEDLSVLRHVKLVMIEGKVLVNRFNGAPGETRRFDGFETI